MSRRPGWLTLDQPPVPPGRLARSSGAVLRYRIMAFATGVVLLAGTVALIMKWVGVHHMEPTTGLLWLGHGYLYLVYVVVTAALGLRMRWPFPRLVLVLLAGTIPTMSFVAEHYVTAAIRRAGATDATSASRAPVRQFP